MKDLIISVRYEKYQNTHLKCVIEVLDCGELQDSYILEDPAGLHRQRVLVNTQDNNAEGRSQLLKWERQVVKLTKEKYQAFVQEAEAIPQDHEVRIKARG